MSAWRRTTRFNGGLDLDPCDMALAVAESRHHRFICLEHGLDPDTTLPEDAALFEVDSKNNYEVTNELKRCFAWKNQRITKQLADMKIAQNKAKKARANGRRKIRN